MKPVCKCGHPEGGHELNGGPCHVENWCACRGYKPMTKPKKKKHRHKWVVYRSWFGSSIWIECITCGKQKND